MIQRLDKKDTPGGQAPDVEAEETAPEVEELASEIEEVAAEEEGARPGRRERFRRRILRSTALLPALFTVSNGLCGFAAIHFATKDAVGAAQMMNLWVAGWLIVAAMVCDLLDGRLARMTRKTSDFGGQLDSLSDAISFGVAPAVLMVRTVFYVLREQATYVALERVILCVAGVYVACAILRLARFNVENEPDEASHMRFTGLPTPGAAGGLTSLVLLFAYYHDHYKWFAGSWLFYSLSIVLPVLALACALLMVSRVDYPHLINQYIRGKRPFAYLVKLVVTALAVMLLPMETAAAVIVAYILWGPLRAAVSALRGRGKSSPQGPRAAGE
jgi:CDP-diacylglycerol--serine O-phosphatidyltransferase